jgi:hypothetical protein
VTDGVGELEGVDVGVTEGVGEFVGVTEGVGEFVGELEGDGEGQNAVPTPLMMVELPLQ